MLGASGVRAMDVDGLRVNEVVLPVSPQVAKRAALFVASMAHDAEDCAMLLDALGLNGRRPRSSRKGTRAIG